MSDDALRERRLDRAAMILLATLSLATSVLLNAGMVCSNDGSQYALTRSLADGTAVIDAHFRYTREVDYAQMGDHYYSDRPPHVAFLALPIYLTSRALGVDDVGSQTAVTGLAHLFGLLSVLLLFMLARRLGASRVGAFAAALALAWCTPHRSYSATLFSHAICAGLVMALAWITLPLDEADTSRRRRLLQLLGGVIGGYACGVDYTAGLPVAILCVIGAWLEGRQQLIADGVEAPSAKEIAKPALRVALVYLVGGVIGAAPALIYHTVVFGAPWSLPYFHDARFTYAHSVGGMYSGSFIEGFFGLLLSPHAGLVVWSPILVFALAFWPRLYKKLGARFWLVLVPWVALYLVTCKNLTWHAGATQDVRYLVSVLPLICLPLAWAFDWAFGIEGKLRPGWLSVMGFLFFVSALIQFAKHNALWARDGSRWIGWIAGSLTHDAGPTLLGFATWAYPHPIAAAVVLALGVTAALALRLRSGPREDAPAIEPTEASA